LIGTFLFQRDLIFEHTCLIILMKIFQSKIKLSTFTNFTELSFIQGLVFMVAITIAMLKLNQETGIIVTTKRFKKLKILIEF